MEKKLSQLKKFKAITLNDEERAIVRAHLARVIIDPPKLVTQSLFQRGVTHGLRIALSTMLFVVFVGASVSAVADNALPGDPLYSFKINVNEEVKGMFLKTAEEKVVWQKNRIENRVSEIKTLAATKTLTKAKQATAQKALDEHVAELSESLGTLSDKSPTAALTVTASLEESLKEEKAQIEESVDAGTTTPSESDGTQDALRTVNDALAKVSKQEAQIISKEIDKIADDVTDEDSAIASEPTEGNAAATMMMTAPIDPTSSPSSAPVGP